MANVKIAVRIRPLTPREATFDQQLAVHVGANNIVHLLNNGPCMDTEWDKANGSNQTRQFSFDYCFEATDGSDPAANIASQDMVFEALGEQVLDAVFEGYNACVLAYGPSGAGKTYTMMGTASEPGLAPKLCKAIFERATPRTVGDVPNESLQNSRPSFRIDVSFMEIYNEKVRDLLVQPLSPLRSVEQLKVREHPKSGPYVQNLSRHVVNDATAALQLLSEGIQRRNSAATHINGHSSRSHAVFTLHCTAAWIVSDGLPRETVAKLHLVDLAGSERANHETVNRLRLKEGSLINKSLACLGNVINALAENPSGNLDRATAVSNSNNSSTCSTRSSSVQTTPSSSPHRSRTSFIPYRDSVLTWILKDSLGGNSRTFLVAAISPSMRAFKETLSTLRFAQRAKRVVNQPVVNEEAGVKLIRHLKEEVSRLRTLLAQSIESKQLNSPGGIRSETLVELMTVNQSKVRELTEDWLQRWRTTEPNEEIITSKNMTRTNNIGVQTALPDPADLIPVKESAIRWDDNEAAGWSDDSLENSYVVDGWDRKGSENYSDDLMLSKPTTRECNKTDSPSVESLTPLWAGSCLHQPSLFPIYVTHGGLKTLKVPKTVPDVGTIYSHSSDFQEETDSTSNSTPAAPSNPSSFTDTQDVLFSSRLSSVYHSTGRHMPPSNSFSESSCLPSDPNDDDILLSRLNSLIEKLRLSKPLSRTFVKSDIQSNHVTHKKSIPTLNKSSCCCTNLKFCICHPKQNHGFSCHCDGYHCQYHCHAHDSKAYQVPSSFESIIRAELLAIRRRMVARTASPKVAKTLPFLMRPSTNSQLVHDTNVQEGNLPGELWV